MDITLKKNRLGAVPRIGGRHQRYIAGVFKRGYKVRGSENLTNREEHASPEAERNNYEGGSFE
jgi:DNA-binding winged helix-turn-helix (wHTH) protein